MMIKKIDFHIPELDLMDKYPKQLFYIGNSDLLKKTKISIIGSRRPISYVKNFTYEISKKLSLAGVCIVSGGAMGVDALAHQGAGEQNTIMVAGTGLDVRYPAVNKKLIEKIEKKGLVLSQFEEKTISNRWNFPIRNELVVALGEVLVAAQADLKSGSMRSIDFALNMNKDIYVLPHRIGESEGTNDLLKRGLAKPIYDIDEFVSQFGTIDKPESDEFLEYCKTYPTYDEAVMNFGDKVFEYELLGNIKIENGVVKPL